MRCGIYYRVSTRDQNPERQIRELREYARLRDFEIVAEFIDKESGAKKRPEHDRLMAMAKARKIDVVLVQAFDRFSRSTADLINSLELFNSLNMDFVSKTEQIDTSTPGGKLTYTVIAGVAEFERAMLIERINSGLDNARAKGKVLGRKTLQRQGIAEKIVRLREEGVSIRQIAKKLKVSPASVQKYIKAA